MLNECVFVVSGEIYDHKAILIGNTHICIKHEPSSHIFSTMCDSSTVKRGNKAQKHTLIHHGYHPDPKWCKNSETRAFNLKYDNQTAARGRKYILMSYDLMRCVWEEEARGISKDEKM